MSLALFDFEQFKVELRAEVPKKYEAVLNGSSLSFMVLLHNKFEASRQELLRDRAVREEKLAKGMTFVQNFLTCCKDTLQPSCQKQEPSEKETGQWTLSKTKMHLSGTEKLMSFVGECLTTNSLLSALEVVQMAFNSIMTTGLSCLSWVCFG